MADELTLRASISFEKGTKSAAEALAPFTVDVAGGNYLDNVQNVGFAAEEALLLADITVGGYVWLRNLDATNFISVRQGTGTTNMIQLKPGDFALFRLSPDTTAPYVIADTGACELEVLLIDL